MPWIVSHLWLIPLLPFVAAGLTALLPRARRRAAAATAIAALGGSLALAGTAFVEALATPARQYVNVRWLQYGATWLHLGWLLDPLTAIMLLMVSLVGLLIFIYSVGYMSHDENFTRFFCFLSLFAGAMLGLVLANSLLLLFICWEIVGLTSYLLIGFWFHKPAAAAAAKKAFITTRIGDLALLLGMVWLAAQSGTLLFYNGGHGCLEAGGLAAVTAITPIALLIFAGAMGKSGQFPLHVWLPDAMEGPTPVSALIHAATMVAAGVFLIARTYPLIAASHIAIETIAWIGAITAVFAAAIAVAQDDIKRILAYSTVSQLGYMMLGLAVGGVAVGMFHLITHACFKALLFLGAGSVIHGMEGEQDIHRMGGLRRFMPVTFATYAAAMLALCGFPLFAGFWSKDAILEAAQRWSVSAVPFYLGAIGALLTAFYMTRQVVYVFFGPRRAAAGAHGHGTPHESPAVMTIPLAILAVFAVGLGWVGTPLWPWFQAFLSGQPLALHSGAFFDPRWLGLAATSSLIVFAGLGLGWWLYGRRPIADAAAADRLERLQPAVFRALAQRLYIDEFYDATVLALARLAARGSDWFDRWVWGGAVRLTATAVTAFGHLDAWTDERLVNGGFDGGCRNLSRGGGLLARLQNGRVQTYLCTIGGATVFFTALLIWGWR